MRNRQKDEIVRDILRAAQGGAGITKIMFQAYLTHGQAKEYGKLLADKGLLQIGTEENSIRHYRTTYKGMQYLAAAEKMAEMLPVAVKRSSETSTFLL